MVNNTILPIYLTINIMSIRLDIPLYSLSNNFGRLSGKIIPFAFDNKCDLGSNIGSNSIPIISNKCFSNELIKKERLHGLIIVDGMNKIDTKIPVFGMSKENYINLLNLLEKDARSQSINQKNKRGSYRTLNNALISHHNVPDHLPLLIQIFLQIPPILTILLIAALWKTFLDEDDGPRTRHYYRYTDTIYNKNVNDSSACSICYEEYENNIELRKLCCGHYYHIDCIEMWLARSNICPMCRKDVYRGGYFVHADVVYM